MSDITVTEVKEADIPHGAGNWGDIINRLFGLADPKAALRLEIGDKSVNGTKAQLSKAAKAMGKRIEMVADGNVIYVKRHKPKYKRRSKKSSEPATPPAQG